ncbi:MAG: ribbon-helix-helix domain-containing protein [Nitrosopumilus sp.]|uniref:ribbon-helix-helix domain-containing protein n=1 Tax=Nitrosopumilus sp. TaxID=2024843 RepID=UPI002430BD51|nr:ribbon-helix-helix domain-containing protein [Nitrosopumilus sp.]MCV0366304.1 ribbon-helix-helix domain-containing protein [Nitrosopumilus sp.]
MKVVGTKLDDSDFERFQKHCTDEGISKSEVMRDLIKKYCDACEDDLQLQIEKSSELKNPTVTIIDD